MLRRPGVPFARSKLNSWPTGSSCGVLTAPSNAMPASFSLPLAQFTNGTVHVKANYDKSYELILMPLQAAVLLPFNDSAWRGWRAVLCCMAFGEAGWIAEGGLHAQGCSLLSTVSSSTTNSRGPLTRQLVCFSCHADDVLSYAELREQTKLPDEDLTRCLASLTLSKYKLLVKVSWVGDAGCLGWIPAPFVTVLPASCCTGGSAGMQPCMAPHPFHCSALRSAVQEGGGKGISHSDKFSVNTKFVDKMRRIRVRGT